MDEKRRHCRVKAVLPVRVSGNDNSGNSYSDLVHTLDITESGARLAALRQPLKVGSLITCSISSTGLLFVWCGPSRFLAARSIRRGLRR